MGADGHRNQPLRSGHRVVPQRRHLPAAPIDVGRPPRVTLPGVRRTTRGGRERPAGLLGGPQGSMPALWCTHFTEVPLRRAGHGSRLLRVGVGSDLVAGPALTSGGGRGVDRRRGHVVRRRGDPRRFGRRLGFGSSIPGRGRPRDRSAAAHRLGRPGSDRHHCRGLGRRSPIPAEHLEPGRPTGPEHRAERRPDSADPDRPATPFEPLARTGVEHLGVGCSARVVGELALASGRRDPRRMAGCGRRRRAASPPGRAFPGRTRARRSWCAGVSRRFGARDHPRVSAPTTDVARATGGAHL